MTISSIASMNFAFGGLTSTVSNATGIQQRLDTLTGQAGSGMVSTTFGGLGATSASSALTLSPALSQVQAWQANVQAAGGRLQAAQSALSQISDIASNFFAQTNNLNGLSATAVDATAASARDALKQVAGLLDTRFGDTYVFAGTDTANPPVPDPENILNSGFTTGIATAVGGLAANGAAATVATTLAVAGSNAAGVSPFSPALSAPAATLAALRPVVQVGDNQFVPVGISASANADVTSAGSSTTGSYIRDIMRALATIGSMSSSQIPAAGFTALVTDTQTSLGGAISALNDDAGVLGNRTASLTAAGQQLSNVEVALKGQISNAQEVDMAQTITSLNATQTQLQASYRMLGTLQSLSLSNFIS